MGILTVGIVTSPLAVEGKIRYEQAFRGIEELSRNVDSLLVINNENIVEMYGRLSLKQAFGKADDILASAPRASPRSSPSKATWSTSTSPTCRR